MDTGKQHVLQLQTNLVVENTFNMYYSKCEVQCVWYFLRIIICIKFVPAIMSE